MAETVQASQQDGHFNESIVNEEILEDMKKNRIDHMKYVPDMEQLGHYIFKLIRCVYIALI